MADVETEDLPSKSKRVCLSPSYENKFLKSELGSASTAQSADIDEKGEIADLGEYSGSFSNSFDKSRKQNGGDSDLQTESENEFHGCDDFPNCFSVEDDLDNIEEHHFQPIAGPMGWIKRQIDLGISPRDVLAYMVPHAQVPPDINNSTLWKIVIDILTDPAPRQKLPHVNTLDDAVNLINSCRNILVLTGAGVSVSCGIPDFRSRDGIYAKLSVEYPDLPDPQAMFDITYFNQNPNPFFKFAKEIFPGQFQPSLSHKFIYQLEKHACLLRNYSQNIDTLEQVAGITRIIQCHGSFNTASCMRCKHQVPSQEISDDILSQKIPRCNRCSEESDDPAIMKPDIVFFGESLPSDFYTSLGDDSDKADLLIVIGSSLKVRPVALIPSHISPEVPQILINREPLRHMAFDVELLGDCDVIIAELCRRLGGSWLDIVEGFTAPPPVKIPPFLDFPSDLVTCDSSTTEERDNSLHHLTPSHEVSEKNSKTMPNTLQQKQSDTQKEHNQGALSEDIFLRETPMEEEEKSEDIVPDAAPNIAIDVAPDVAPNVASGVVTDIAPDVAPDVVPDVEHEESSARKGTSELVSDLISLQSTPERLSSEDAANFIFLPPSRYIFSGAELCNSPLSSPRADISHLIPSDDDSDSESEGSHVGSGVSYGSADSNLGVRVPNGHADSRMSSGVTNDRTGGHVLLHDLEGGGYSSGDGSEGYGSGVPSGNDLSTQELKFITGGLYSYSCASEENTAMSVADLLADHNSLQTSYDALVGSSDLRTGVTDESAGSSGYSAATPEKPALSGQWLQPGPFSSLGALDESDAVDSSKGSSGVASEKDGELQSAELHLSVDATELAAMQDKGGSS